MHLKYRPRLITYDRLLMWSVECNIVFALNIQQQRAPSGWKEMSLCAASTCRREVWARSAQTSNNLDCANADLLLDMLHLCHRRCVRLLSSHDIPDCSNHHHASGHGNGPVPASRITRISIFVLCSIRKFRLTWKLHLGDSREARVGRRRSVRP